MYGWIRLHALCILTDCLILITGSKNCCFLIYTYSLFQAIAIILSVPNKTILHKDNGAILGTAKLLHSYPYDIELKLALVFWIN